MKEEWGWKKGRYEKERGRKGRREGLYDGEGVATEGSGHDCGVY